MGSPPPPATLWPIGLDYHFCAFPKAFHVNGDELPFTYSSVATDAVKFLLIKIGVFAVDGIIFHIHHDRQAAVNDVIYLTTVKRVGGISNFESSKASEALLKPTL